MRNILLLIFVGAIGITTNNSEAAFGIDSPLEQEAYDFIAGKAENSLRIVTSNQSKGAKAAQLRSFFSTDNFAWTHFSWMVLGRVAREISRGRKFKNPEDEAVFQEYSELMARYFSGMYAKYLAQYDASTFRVKNVVERTGKHFNSVTVYTEISTRDDGGRSSEMANGRESVNIEFELCDREEGKLKVCNASVMGFNLMATFRSEHNRWFYNEANWTLRGIVEIFRNDVEGL